MNKHGNRPLNGKQAMSANLRKIARQNQLYGFRMALDGIAATWGALIQNLRCDADLTDEQVQKIIRIGDRYWEMVGQFTKEDMTPDEFASYIVAKSGECEKTVKGDVDMSVKPEMIRDEFFNDWYLGCPICKTRIGFPMVKNPMDYRPKCCVVCKAEFDWSGAEKKGLR